MTDNGNDSRRVETHTAYLLLLGDRVYKWKKPVDLGFVDLRTLDARRRACAAEVGLNRGLAAHVYLDVDVLVDGAASPVEQDREVGRAGELRRQVGPGVDFLTWSTARSASTAGPVR